MLEPDGQRSHWLKMDQALLMAAGVGFGDVAELELSSAAQEPEPETPANLAKALKASPAAQATWLSTTLARVVWIHWVTSAKQVATRAKRAQDGCDMLASGKMFGSLRLLQQGLRSATMQRMISLVKRAKPIPSSC